MLKSVNIRNYVIIDEVNIDFHNGFSVITGETGSGKSIILDALSLLFGKRADISVIQKNYKWSFLVIRFLKKVLEGQTSHKGIIKI